MSRTLCRMQGLLLASAVLLVLLLGQTVQVCADGTGALPVLTSAAAEKIVDQTCLIVGYMGIRGETDYAASPAAVIRAALFGAYDARMEAEDDSPPGRLKNDTVFLQLKERRVTGRDVVLRDAAPGRFRKVHRKYTAWISRQAAEVAALIFTGHRIRKHMSLKGNGFLEDSLYRDGGYYVHIDGRGDLPTEPVLRNVRKVRNGYALTGEIRQLMGDEERRPVFFRITVVPGEEAGTWKRTYEESPRAVF